MNRAETITVPRRIYLSILACLALSTAAHLFRLAVDFTR